MKPSKLWMKAINWTAKCQDKTIEQQYQAGIRYFDIRIRFNQGASRSIENTDKWVKLVHGLVEYKGSFTQLMEYLSNKGNCTLRILLDDRHNCDKKKQTEILQVLAPIWKSTYNINLWNIWRLSDETLVYDYDNPMPPVDGQYGSANGIGGLWPKMWEKHHKYTPTDKQYLMRDFV